MRTKEYPLVPLFEKFIKYSKSGRRLQKNGQKIQIQTIANYTRVLAYILEFQIINGNIIRIRTQSGFNRVSYLRERNYWKNFHLQFTNYLYYQKNYFDNWVGAIMRILRACFSFLNLELAIPTGLFYKDFYVCEEEIPIITLLPDQLRFLINDLDFENSLSKSLKKTKDILVFGCTVGLRFGDLFAMRFTDVHSINETLFLEINTTKTRTIVRIKLPAYAVSIIEKFRSCKKIKKDRFPAYTTKQIQ